MKQISEIPKVTDRIYIRIFNNNIDTYSVQIISENQLDYNITLVAKEIIVEDYR